MKKFYDHASYEASEGSFVVMLDGKPVHTPAKNPLMAPNETTAIAMVEEWQGQGDEIDKMSLPMTSFASLAIDIAGPQRDALIEELLEYGETDLLFYRDDNEVALQEQQKQEWQPWIDWAQKEYDTHYILAGGIMPVAQPAENRAKHRMALNQLNQWQLAGLAAVVKPTTSLILGLAFLRQKLDDGELYRLSRLEESFNVAKWGEDNEARQAAENVAVELRLVAMWLNLLAQG